MANVTLSGLTKRFGPVEVLKGIDLEIEDGELIVLVGPSGCGKSTLLRCIAGLESITCGDLAIDGRSVARLHPKDRDIAMVFQSYALYPHMTVQKNMAFGLKIRRTPANEIARLVDEAAELLGLGELLARYPRELSGGQRQRVAMGRAIVRRPKVFLFDEPLSNLDAALRVQMRTELARLHQRLGATMIYVTHDQVEAMTLADRIVVLHAGALQQVGPPLELYHRPTNRFVGTFIGSPSMTLVPAEVLSTDGEGCRLRALGRELSLPLGAGLTAGAKVELGLRPEHATPVAPGEGLFEGTVELVEPMGFDTVVYVAPEIEGDVGDGQRAPTLVCRTQGQAGATLEAGTRVSIEVPLAELRLFAGEQGDAVG